MTAHLSQLRVRKDASLRSVTSLFSGKEEGALDRRHKLLWSAFAQKGQPDAPRDFLWRSVNEGHYVTISSRAPKGNELLEVVSTKPFDPKLVKGQNLRFALRGAAQKSTFHHDRPGFQKGRGKKECLLGAARRAGVDPAIAVREWLTRQGERNGFSLTEEFSLDQDRLEKFRPGLKHGIFDVSGRLVVTDPAAMSRVLLEGLGRQKSFGCGLLVLGA